ncbi:MAG: DUF1553 domain-containing protein [Planctomycetes bacterium]|nr:DUF1553 domain-containing protein [Planctomycetota bacterium]
MRILFLMLFVVSASASTADGQSARIDFHRDVLPILDAKCFSCHRGADATASYRLDLRDELLGETTGKPLVKLGKSAESRLIHAVTGKTPGKLMPRKGPPLSEREIGILRAWIDQGLAWDDKLFPAQLRSDHWAFQPIKAPAVPKVTNAAWVRTPVDAFIAARHADLGLAPARAADGRTLLRRTYLDVTGLPPTGQQLDDYLGDCASAKPQAAYEKLVERLLASPHYGERWARHWLDVARFAESEGYESNHTRLHAWRYRDWVVNAFNRDLPFADFVAQQIAGDEITPYADDHLIATGFLAAARLSSNEEDRLRQRNDIYVDIVNTTASAFLGLTMQCAQCHNHKFDPITARDYHRLMGYFVKGQPGNLALRDPKLLAEFNAKKPKGYDEAVKTRDDLYEAARQRKIAETEKSLTPAQKRALALPRENRTVEQDKIAREVDLLFQFSSGQIERAFVSQSELVKFKEAKLLVGEMERTMVEKPQTFGYYSPATSPHRVDVLPMKGFYPLPYEPKELARARSFLYESGDVHRPAFLVDAGWPSVFVPSPHRGRGAGGEGAESRLALAQWLTSKDNPLAARVYVNRIWQQHFGRGLVASSSDFGVKGAKPTHPDLLDYLASELLRTGSTKQIHRLILMSSTYQQSSGLDAASEKGDPDNRYLSRWQPRRLEAEAIRDSFLAVSDELDRGIGGASDQDTDKSVRRTLYLFQKREAPPKVQALFDGPIGMTESCGRRQTTTVPLQPLYLLNSEFSVARARAFAERVIKIAGTDRDKQMTAVYRLALARALDAKERELAHRFFARADADAALRHYCQAILNLNEFAYIE